MRTTGELKLRLLAIPEGGSAVFAGVPLKALRTACWRLRCSGEPYRVRTEGKGEAARLVVYHGVPAARVITQRNGTRLLARQPGTARAQRRVGFAETRERWFGYDMVGLIAAVDRGYRYFCARRGLDPALW